jgi:hypothetical protein
MVKGYHRQEWGMQLVVLVFYATLFELLRPLAHAPWMVLAGLRLGCLLMVPRRYWLAMAAGECLSGLHVNLQCAYDYGYLWAVLRSVPPILYAMPIVGWFHARNAIFPARGGVAIGSLLLCVTAVAATWATVSFGLLGLMTESHDGPHVVLNSRQLIGYLLGNYLGCLTFVPLVPMIELDLRRGQLLDRVGRAVESPAFWEALLLLVPVIAVAASVSPGTWEGLFGLDARDDHAYVQWAARTSMFVPIFWLAMNRGWRPVAFGCSLAIGSIAATMVALPDPSVLMTEAVLAIAVTCLMLMGARQTARLDFGKSDRLNLFSNDESNGITSSFNEMRTLQLQQAMRALAGTIAMTPSAVPRSFSVLTPDEQMYQRLEDASVEARRRLQELATNGHDGVKRPFSMQRILANRLAPCLEDAGVHFRLVGDTSRLACFDHEFQQGVAALASEVAANLGKRTWCSEITFHIKCGVTNNRPWIALRASGEARSWTSPADDPVIALNRACLAARLGAANLELREIQRYVQRCGGRLHSRTFVGGERLSFMLWESASAVLRENCPAEGRRFAPRLLVR